MSKKVSKNVSKKVSKIGKNVKNCKKWQKNTTFLHDLDSCWPKKGVKKHVCAKVCKNCVTCHKIVLHKLCYRGGGIGLAGVNSKLIDFDNDPAGIAVTRVFIDFAKRHRNTGGFFFLRVLLWLFSKKVSKIGKKPRGYSVYITSVTSQQVDWSPPHTFL